MVDSPDLNENECGLEHVRGGTPQAQILGQGVYFMLGSSASSFTPLLVNV